jgi:NAD(P)-dependent dehydrogenase (short-subunit alcohol dehydrogenase family)
MSTKRTVLITGCSDGSLGASLAIAFQKAGWRVLASGRNLNKLKRVQAASIETVELDVGSDESVAASMARVWELTGGGLDALVNNAGGGYSMPLIHVDLDKARALFELNVFSVVRVTQAYVPLLRESKAPGGALLVNNTTASSLASGALPFQGTYCMSKAAATMCTELLRLELGPFGIRVVNLMTGAIKSTFQDNAIKATLPADSPYIIAKEAIEKAMVGGETNAKASDPEVWAAAVVKDFTKSKPPHSVWRGYMATTARPATWFPVGFLDFVVKGLTGLDILEKKKIREQGRVSKLKHTWYIFKYAKCRVWKPSMGKHRMDHPSTVVQFAWKGEGQSRNFTVFKDQVTSPMNMSQAVPGNTGNVSGACVMCDWALLSHPGCFNAAQHARGGAGAARNQGTRLYFA